MIKKSNSIIDKKVKNLVQKRIERNAFFAHSENILLAQLASEKKSERVDAIRKILKIRERIHTDGVRPFRVPIINFKANKWIDMIDYDNDSTEPPFTMNMTEQELIEIRQRPLEVPTFKCHTQMVERAVKEVTRVSLKTIDHEKRNAMVKATLIHRGKYPKLDSVKDFSIRNHQEPYLPKI